MNSNLRGELTIYQKEFFSLHSNAFVNGLLKIMNIKPEDKESHLIVNTLFPTIINELVDKVKIILKRYRGIWICLKS